MKLYRTHLPPEHEILRHVRVSAQRGASLMVYQASSGQTGFDVDSASENLAHLLLEDASGWSWSSKKAFPAFKELRDLRMQLNPFAVTFHLAQDQWLAALNGTSNINKIVSATPSPSHNPPSDAMAVPELAAVWLTKNGLLSAPALASALANCRALSIWRIGSGEFGLHVLSFENEPDSHASERVRRLCDACHVELKLVDSSQMPAW